MLCKSGGHSQCVAPAERGGSTKTFCVTIKLVNTMSKALVNHMSAKSVASNSRQFIRVTVGSRGWVDRGGGDMPPVPAFISANGKIFLLVLLLV